MVFLLALALIAAMQPSRALAFKAESTWVVDGDTFRFRAALLNVSVTGTCRMLGYNAPEPRGKERELGLQARQMLEELIRERGLEITATKKDKYGRWLCQVRAGDESVNDKMRELLAGYAGLDRYTSIK